MVIQFRSTSADPARLLRPNENIGIAEHIPARPDAMLDLPITAFTRLFIFLVASRASL